MAERADRRDPADEGAVVKTRRGVQETASDKLAVCFTCEWCGARIELIPTERGTEIANAQAFLAQHAGCLRQRSRE